MVKKTDTLEQVKFLNEKNALMATELNNFKEQLKLANAEKASLTTTINESTSKSHNLHTNLILTHEQLNNSIQGEKEVAKKFMDKSKDFDDLYENFKKLERKHIKLCKKFSALGFDSQEETNGMLDDEISDESVSEEELETTQECDEENKEEHYPSIAA